MFRDDPNLVFAQQELESARQQGDRFGEFSALARFAEIFSSMAEVAESQNQEDWRKQNWQHGIEYFQQAWGVAHELGDGKREQGLKIEIEHAQWRLEGGKSDAYYFHALTLSQQVADRNLEQRILSIISFNFAIKSDFENALPYELQALDIAREIGDSQLIVENLRDLGGIYAGLDNYELAIRYYEEALTIKRSSNDAEAIANLQATLAEVYQNSGNSSKAIEYYEKAIAIKREIEGRKPLLEYFLNKLAYLYLSLQDKDHAVACFEEILQTYRLENNQDNELRQLSLVAIVLNNSTNDQKLAMQYAEQYLALARVKDDYMAVTTALHIISKIYCEAGDFEQGLKIRFEIISIAREHQNLMIERQALARLSGVHKQLGHPNEAVDYLRQYYVMGSQMNDSFSMHGLARIYEDEGQLMTALEYYQKALDIFTMQKLEDWIKTTQEKMTNLREKIEGNL